MGRDVETLANLTPVSPRAIIVGLNPSPVSVQAGHYWSGRLGQLLFTRLRDFGVLTPRQAEFDDDDAYSQGIGFTDLVKRPTARGDGVTSEELRYGSALLPTRLERTQTPVVIFVFKAAAVPVLGHFSGNGWLNNRLAGAHVFVMPGPYESAATANETMITLLPGLPPH